jgi:hypothetical protein
VTRQAKVIIAFLTFLCATTVIAQDDRATPDRWAGMVINTSAPDDAIRLFGTPSKDKNKVILDVPRPISWLSDKWKEKTFRTLTYKQLQGYKNVQFFFLEEKLVAISMEAPDADLAILDDKKWIDPDDLEQLFGIVFKPNPRQHGIKLLPPSEFLANAPAELKKEGYADFYDMIAVSENSFVVAMITNPQYYSGLFDRPDARRQKKINAHGARYPGSVSYIEMLSRTLAR